MVQSVGRPEHSLWSGVQPPLGSKIPGRKTAGQTVRPGQRVSTVDGKAYVRIGADKIGYESERIQNKSGHQIWGNCWKLSRVSGKIVKIIFPGKKCPFRPDCMGRSRVELSLAPPRAAERRELSGKFQSHGFNSGETRKLWPDRELDPCLRTTGPKKPTARL